MTKLEKVISEDFSKIQKRSNALFNVYMKEIGVLIDAAKADVLATVASILAYHTQPITYSSLKSHGTLDRLQRTIEHRLDVLALDIENYWDTKRNSFDLISRLSVAFISRKSAPPWIKTNLNLKDKISTDGKFDPRRGHIRFYFRNLSDFILKQIQQATLKEESLNQTLARIRKLFDRNEKRGIREQEFDPNKLYVDANDDNNQFDLSRGKLNISEGTYTLEDVEDFQSDQIKANAWESRQYRPYFSDSLKANNRYLRDLEQTLMSDAVEQLHSGQLQLGSKEMGIDDMLWRVSFPQKECDECTDRDGMTMTDIQDTIKDKYRGLPPPLHPNCKCQLVPKIKDDWAKETLSKQGIEWNPDTGATYSPDEQERSYGIRNMTFDQFIKNIGVNQ